VKGRTAVPEELTRDPADNRYISFATETFFQPRKGEEIRSSIKDVQPGNAVDAIAKRIPIRLRVRMESSQIHRLVAACGNAPFPLEVYQVRVNTEAASSSGGGGGYGGGMGGMGGMPGVGGGGWAAWGCPAEEVRAWVEKAVWGTAAKATAAWEVVWAEWLCQDQSIPH
jgi:hypothetical protein